MPESSKLKKGEILEINTWFTDQLYPIRLRFVGMDDVKVKGGRIKCYKFNPVTEVGRLFKTEEDVSFWFQPIKIFCLLRYDLISLLAHFWLNLAALKD